MATQRQSTKVLILDPYQASASSMQEVFTRAGYDTRSAYNEDEALALASMSPPDLAVIELLLLHRTGPEFSIALRSFCPGCSILFVFAQAAESVHEEARAQGFQVLAKPIHPEVLLKVASNTLGETIGYSSFK